jgi:HD-like signal output (HDOD) protein
MMKQRVMFVDDEPRVLEGLRRMLWALRHEWEMEFVTSGREALELLDRLRFDVVVTDMRMPGMTGAELLTLVRDRHPEVVRLILSGQASEEAAAKSVGPAHQFLAKPCDAETLRNVIRRACSLRSLLNSEPLQNLVSQIGTLPSPPPQYLKLMQELEAREPSMRRVADVIAADPAMSAKVLQLVNSAFFGLQRHISDPAQASMMLGLHTVSMLALSVHVFATYGAAAGVGELMSHSVRTAAFARSIGAQLSTDQATVDDCCAAGLLHDVGKLVLATTMGERFERMRARVKAEGLASVDAERDEFGATHAEVGGYLLGLWGLPDPVVEAVAYHHRPGDLTPSVPLTAIHVGNALEMTIDGGEPMEAAMDIDYLTRAGVADRISAWAEECRRSTEAAGPDGVGLTV